MTVNLTTVARVQAHLEYGGADPVPSTGDSLTTTLIGAYSTVFEEYLARRTERTYRTEYHDVERGQHVFALNAYPNVSITTITNDNSREWDTGDLTSDDYALDDENGLLMVDWYALTPGFQALRVKYTGGLGTNTTAIVRDYQDLAHACDLQVVHHIHRRDQLGVTGHAIGGGSQSFPGPFDWLPTVRAILDRRKRVRL